MCDIFNSSGSSDFEISLTQKYQHRPKPDINLTFFDENIASNLKILQLHINSFFMPKPKIS